MAVQKQIKRDLNEAYLRYAATFVTTPKPEEPQPFKSVDLVRERQDKHFSPEDLFKNGEIGTLHIGRDIKHFPPKK
jgi:hypothetical protein